MKVRNKYVSNSSSSSFIIKDDPAFAEIDIYDWYRMIRDLYENYSDVMMKRIETAKEYGWKLNDVFSAFDLLYDRKEAINEIGGLLSQFEASNATVRNGAMERVESDPREELDCFVEQMREEVKREYKADYVGIDLYSTAKELDDDGKEYSKSEIIGWKDKKQIEIPNAQEYFDRIEAKRDSLGICNNLQVLENEQSRFAIHFDDNECWKIKGVASKGEEWESEEYSYERLCEIFTKWFKEDGKLPADFNWRKMLDLTLTVCMHEG